MHVQHPIQQSCSALRVKPASPQPPAALRSKSVFHAALLAWEDACAGGVRQCCNHHTSHSATFAAVQAACAPIAWKPSFMFCTCLLEECLSVLQCFVATHVGKLDSHEWYGITARQKESVACTG